MVSNNHYILLLHYYFIIALHCYFIVPYRLVILHNMLNYITSSDYQRPSHYVPTSKRCSAIETVVPCKKKRSYFPSAV